MPQRPDRHRDPYRQAALAYCVLGALVVMLTIATPEMARPERRADLAHLLIGLPVFLVFALLIAWGDLAAAGCLRLLGVTAERARQLGQSTREKLVMLLSLSALMRTLVFLANGLGARPRFALASPRLRIEAATPEPRMWFAAALMAVILWLLVRASWLPWMRRRQG